METILVDNTAPSLGPDLRPLDSHYDYRNLLVVHLGAIEF